MTSLRSTTRRAESADALPVKYCCTDTTFCPSRRASACMSSVFSSTGIWPPPAADDRDRAYSVDDVVDDMVYGVVDGVVCECAEVEVEMEEEDVYPSDPS
jgi:hypothetical protein